MAISTKKEAWLKKMPTTGSGHRLYFLISPIERAQAAVVQVVALAAAVQAVG